jgi:hypothetical protein
MFASITLLAIAAAIAAACLNGPVSEAQISGKAELGVRSSVPAVRLWLASPLLGAILGLSVGCLLGAKLRVAIAGALVGIVIFFGGLVSWFLANI